MARPVREEEEEVTVAEEKVSVMLLMVTATLLADPLQHTSHMYQPQQKSVCTTKFLPPVGGGF